ncbi:Dut dUTPase [uncultured Caudovirales phage]|uniref:dUTP diphosphatase n=1 Tax=uncultured Caudovirales phage TaxID=2100421 RepID=A0A6J5LIW0_9CAUD|nr:Dut dUTPase [uncultured Caudovirales phage]
MDLQVKFNSEFPPSRAGEYDAGIDLRATQTYNIDSCRKLVSTGVYVKIPRGYVGLLIARSSLSKKGIMLTNSVGVIDSDYRGELLVSLMCWTPGGAIIEAGERIAQLVITPIALPKLVQFNGTDEEWLDTERGIGGFGSTGKV